MKRSIIDNHYLIVRNFIEPERAKKLSNQFKTYCDKNDIKSDTQIPNTPAKYNYISFLEVLCEKTLEVSNIIGETVLPTYCYSRVYKKGDVLAKHTDRDACEISLTVHLDGDKEWSIFVQDPKNNEIEVNLKQGDALLYLGCEAPHWRNSYDGDFYSQVFLHYVRSMGEKAYAYFDNKNKDFFKLTDNMDNNDIEIMEDMKFITKASSKLGDFIEVFENIIPENLCDEIISQYSNDSSWESSKISNDIVDTTVRNCKILSISSSETISKNQFIRKSIDDKVFEIVSSVIDKVREQFPTLNISKDTGYGLLKYDTGGFYSQHTDSYTAEPRAISCSLILNDDYEGGEFAFFNRELIYKLKKGSVIAFPSNHLYPHEIMPITSGTRYSIITWFI